MMELNDCPYCGSDDTYVASGVNGFLCGCNDCDARTPLFNTFDGAVEFWNKGIKNWLESEVEE